MPNTLSWERIIDDGYDLPAPERVEQQAADRDEVDRILSQLYAADPALVQMVELAAAGYSKKEIAEIMQLPLITVYKRFERISRIGNKYREES